MNYKRRCIGTQRTSTVSGNDEEIFSSPFSFLLVPESPNGIAEQRYPAPDDSVGFHLQ